MCVHRVGGCTQVSYVTLKAPEVDETRVGQVTWVVVIDAEEEVQGEGGDHGGEELRMKHRGRTHGDGDDDTNAWI